jgi:hypothetical protein
LPIGIEEGKEKSKDKTKAEREEEERQRAAGAAGKPAFFGWKAEKELVVPRARPSWP